MYIRRKVFSLLEDEMGEERYFSTTDFELTDDVEERYYSNDEDKKGMSKAAKVALGTGAGLAAVAGGIYGGKKFGPKLVSAAEKAKTKALFKALDDEIAGKEVKGAITRKARMMKSAGEGMQKPAKYIESGYKSLKEKLSKVGKKAAKEGKKTADKK